MMNLKKYRKLQEDLNELFEKQERKGFIGKFMARISSSLGRS